jgi:hypothetical protein
MKSPLIGGLLSGDITRRSSTGSAPHAHRGVDVGKGLGVRDGEGIIRGGGGTRTARAVSGDALGRGGGGEGGGGGAGGGGGGAGGGGVEKGTRLSQSKSPTINQSTASYANKYRGSRKKPGSPALLPRIVKVQPSPTDCSVAMSHSSVLKADVNQVSMQPTGSHSSSNTDGKVTSQGDTLTPLTGLKSYLHPDGLSPLLMSSPTLPLPLDTHLTVLKPLGCSEGPSTGASTGVSDSSSEGSSEASTPGLPGGAATPPVITRLRSAYSLSLFWPDQPGEPRDMEELSMPSSRDGDNETPALGETATKEFTGGETHTGPEGCPVKLPTTKKPLMIVVDESLKGDIFETLGATPVDDEGWDQDSSNSSTPGRDWRTRGVVHSSASELTISLAAYRNMGVNYSQKKALSYDSQGNDSLGGEVFNGCAIVSRSTDESDPGSLCSESGSFRFSLSHPNMLDLGLKGGDKGEGNRNSNANTVKTLGTRRVSLVPEGNENEEDV